MATRVHTTQYSSGADRSNPGFPDHESSTASKWPFGILGGCHQQRRTLVCGSIELRMRKGDLILNSRYYPACARCNAQVELDNIGSDGDEIFFGIVVVLDVLVDAMRI
jgi:hypothetical protein